MEYIAAEAESPIEKGDFLQKEHGKAVFRAKRFVEKPPREQPVSILIGI